MEAPGRTDRILGRVRGIRPGPTLLGIGGLHGNETAGVEALKRVLRSLEGREEHLHGEFVAVVGNVPALEAGRRFIDRDLNRAWTPKRLERLREEHSLNGCSEDREQVELLQVAEEIVEEARGPVYALDLHTTSGFGGSFSTFGDSLPNREFAAQIPVPMVLGLEELVEGTFLSFLGRHGLITVAFESGQHEEPEAVDRAEAGLWIALEAAGLFRNGHLPEAREGRLLLAGQSRGLPRALEMRYRYDVTPETRFRMRPGFRNFQPVFEGQALAEEHDGVVKAPWTGRILMPLYQEQGEDGFFLVREFGTFWLGVSKLLRLLKTDRVVHWLPGVRRVDRDRDVVRINKHVARWFARHLFHLLGFRQEEEDGDRIVMRRRRYDEIRFVHHPPPPEHLVE
ncbi:MAG: succinylglutamate desuccinylase/aspartoacylase family protein [Gemmatimonadota bacterium]